MDRNASPMTIALTDSCSGNNDLLSWAGGMRFSVDGSHQNHSYPSWWRKGSVSTGLLNSSSVPGSWSAVLFVIVVCSLVRLGSLGSKEKCSRGNFCSAKKWGTVASWDPLWGDPRASIPATHCRNCRARWQGPTHTNTRLHMQRCCSPAHICTQENGVFSAAQSLFWNLPFLLSPWAQHSLKCIRFWIRKEYKITYQQRKLSLGLILWIQ